MTQDSLLVEVGCEELPFSSIRQTAKAIEENIRGALTCDQMTYTSLRSVYTPRRIAIIIEGLILMQPDSEKIRKGPKLEQAFQGGVPTTAATGFARSCGVGDVGELVDEGEGRLIHRELAKGLATSKWLMDKLPKLISHLPGIQTMRWSEGDECFPRPVHWLTVVLGQDVIPIEVLKSKASDVSYGHRFHAPGLIRVKPSNYFETLKKCFVIADDKERRLKVQQSIKECLPKSMTCLEDDELLDEVNALVEWPRAFLGRVEDKFLSLPSAMLIAVMKTHQKSFAVTDDEGVLQPFFIGVNNIDTENLKQVVKDYECVMHARLEDAYFFYHQDLKKSLNDHAKGLGSVVFQDKLGSLQDRVKRVGKLAKGLHYLINEGDEVDFEQLYSLSKADLMTCSVYEFPELESIIGEHLALNQGLDKLTASIIRTSSMPKFANDHLPNTLVSQCLSMAEKIDAIVGFIGIDQMPTADKDPFGIRRSAIGCLRLSIEGTMRVDLRQAILLSLETYKSVDFANKDTEEQVLVFIFERLKSWCHQHKIPVSVYHSVKAMNLSSLYDASIRMKAAIEFMKLPEAETLIMAHKRVSQILKKSELASKTFIEGHLVEQAEIELWKEMQLMDKDIIPRLENQDYSQVMHRLAQCKPFIDNFFDKVMVMSENKKLRDNRIALLSKLENQMSSVVYIGLL
jgi:glycyl-tRNA synthetase beta chain